MDGLPPARRLIAHTAVLQEAGRRARSALLCARRRGDDGDILQIGEDVERVAGQTLDLMLSSGGELVTIVSGAELADEVLDRLNDDLASNHPGADVTVYEGGQPIWPVIFGVE